MKSAKTAHLRLLLRAFSRLTFDLNFSNSAPEHSPARRDFLKKTIQIAAVSAVSPASVFKNFGQNLPRTAIVGAGLGGMTAAWHLQKSGIRATVFEASHRVGGRTFSVRDQFGQGTATDIGGEFVDDWHADLRELAADLGIEIYDLRESEAVGTASAVFYRGKLISEKDLVAAILPFRETILADIARIPPRPNYQNLAPAKDLDDISIAAYLEKKGIGGWLFDFLCSIFTHEYGMDAAEQSALNMLCFLKLPAPGDETSELIGGEGSEVMKIRGGTMSLCEKMRDGFSGEIRLNQALTRLEKTGETFQLTFDEGQTFEADAVVLAIPFTKLREIDLKIPLSEPKRRAISELGYGNSSKLILGFKKPKRLKNGFPAYFSTDLPFANSGYDAHPGQIPPDGEAAITLFTGGYSTRRLLDGDLADNTRKSLASMNQLFPGLKKRWNKKSMLWPWEMYQWSKAGYSSWKVGQWQAFAGAEGEPEGRVFFAGEHCSIDFQGFMNGAVQTGRLAAAAIANGKW